MTVAFLFPGQAAQRPDMAAVWGDDPAADAFDVVGAAGTPDLRTRADDAEACAASTALAQPAIMAASLTAFDALAAAGVHPDVVAGHSLGEVTAATAAGVLDRDAGAALVTTRGQAMGEACAASPGTMAAILKLDVEEVADLVDRVPGAAVANNNAPGQVVVAGPPEAVDAVVDRAGEAGGRAKLLDVEGAFHSAAMAPAVDRVRAVLDDVVVHDPGPTFLSGIDGHERTTGADVADALVAGILSPVRWVDVQLALVDHGVDLLVECGPGGILAGCAKRTVRDLTCLGVAGPTDVDAVVAHLAPAAT